jgi:hypothetical protein
MDNFKTADILKKFKFLDQRAAQEPNIFDILNEILNLQTQSLPSGQSLLATMDWLKESRNIKIPYTTARSKNIEYLMDLLLRNYPANVKKIVTFNFAVEENTKKLDIVEVVEFTVMLDENNFEKLKAMRDAASVSNLMNFLKKFRIMNISKLLKRTNYKSDLSRVIKYELGKSIFTFKYFSSDKNKIEYAEDYCFHAQNYNAVKTSLNFDRLKEIISIYADIMGRKMKNFGILSTDFDDYRDSKLDYLFNVLMDESSTPIMDKELIEVKNIHSLRMCLIKVDKILDPAQTLSDDIVKFIKENRVCTREALTGSIAELTPEILADWESAENLLKYSVISYSAQDGPGYLIDAAAVIDMMTQLIKTVVNEPERLDAMTSAERQKTESTLEILYRASKNFLSSEENAMKMFGLKEKVENLRSLVDVYESFRKKQSLKKDMKDKNRNVKKKRSIFTRIRDFILSLFRRSGGETDSEKALPEHVIREMSSETKQLYEKVIVRNAPVIALSDFYELIPQNDYLIDRVIDDLREHDAMIVIPIYNARKVLYPKKSQKLIIPDIEYLLISPEVAKKTEDIRSFCDSLSGYNLKDETMPGRAIMGIEKYLLSVYRQKNTRRRRRD